MFSKKITLYNKSTNVASGKKGNTTKIFLFVIIFVILVIVFIQSISISELNSNTNTNSESIFRINTNSEILNNDNINNINNENVKPDDNNNNNEVLINNINNYNKNANHNSLTPPPRSYTKKEKVKTEADLENERKTKLEREILTDLVIKEWKNEVEIIKKLDQDPGYSSLPKLVGYTPPTGQDLENKVKDPSWKLKAEENPFLLPKPHIFVHIPKTAGSSLSGIFKRNERRDKFVHHWMHPNYKELTPLVNKDTVFGHIRYGLHEYFERNDPNRLPAHPLGLNKYSYMTMLREPVDRVISNYYYHKQNRKDPFHDMAMQNELKDWIKISPAANNEQARMLCGLGWSDFGNSTIYDIAHHHLKYTYKHVGLTEHFIESLVLLSHYGGLQNIRFSKINTGRQRVSVDKVPDEVRKEIEERNWIDVSLYKMAVEIYNKEIDLIGREFFEKEVEEYKRKYLSKQTLPNIRY